MQSTQAHQVFGLLTRYLKSTKKALSSFDTIVWCAVFLLLIAKDSYSAPLTNGIAFYHDEYVITKALNSNNTSAMVGQLSAEDTSTSASNANQFAKHAKIVRKINRQTDLVIPNKVATSESQGVAAMTAIQSSDDICKNLISAGLAETCTPNYKLSISQVSGSQASGPDPLSSTLWGLSDSIGVAAESAWPISQGSRQVVVAVIDTGIDYTHEDLTDNIWTNPYETPGNGIDDDGNGVIDDVHGARFTATGAIGDPLDNNQHGTHVAGTIGATHNNGIGVRGVSPLVYLLPIKFLEADGSGRLSDAIAAIDYMVDLKVRLGVNIKVANCSWGGGGYSPALEAAINRASEAGIIIVTAAGNSGSDNDATPMYPANYDIPNILSVGAIDKEQNLASFSNYGAQSVDIAAPGVGITSTLPGQRYGSLSGTSMAAPHVSGGLALLFAYQNNLSVSEAINRVLETGRDSATLASPDGSIAYIKSRRVLDLKRLLNDERTPITDPSADQPQCGYSFEVSNVTDSPGLDQAADLTNPINQADEGDIKEIALPFDFPFFRTSTRSIYLSPNGVVYLVPPRGSDYQIAARAPNYSIAAFQTDLTPRNARQGARAYVGNDRVVIFWNSELYAYPGLGPVTVRLTLYRDGLIRSTISFENSSDPDRLALLALGNGLTSPASVPLGLIGLTAGSVKQSSTLDISDTQRRLASRGGSTTNLAVTMLPNCFQRPTSVPPSSSPNPLPPNDKPKPETPPTDGGSLAKLNSIRMRLTDRERKISVRLRGIGSGAVVLQGAVNGRVCKKVISADISNGLGSMSLLVPSSARRIEIFNSDTSSGLSIPQRRGRVRRMSSERLCSLIF